MKHSLKERYELPVTAVRSGLTTLMFFDLVNSERWDEANHF
ncbi:hypothetical protein SP19_148 [Salmonella phage 19]|nr:hypothetical protein SP19_148 [Salmonella phage 19]